MKLATVTSLLVAALTGLNVDAFTLNAPNMMHSTRAASLAMSVEEIDSKEVKVGVIGCGRIGIVHLGAITKAPGVVPVIVSNPTVSKAENGKILSAKSVAKGFSQKTCFPFAAHALICSAWYCDGEQIQTASTSGLVMTSIASPVNFGTPNCLAAAQVFGTL